MQCPSCEEELSNYGTGDLYCESCGRYVSTEELDELIEEQNKANSRDFWDQDWDDDDDDD